jgi:CRISP-associated protein Cas1
MVGRVVDLSTDGRHLSLFRGFLVVSENGEEIGRIGLDGIAAVMANAHSLTYSNSALVELASRGISTVLCGPNHRPEALVWPVDGHHEQSGHMADQANAGAPLKKRLWAQIVRAKILAQGATLASVGARHGGFQLLSRKVKSGDPENVEAQAARRYWPLLMGHKFRRDRAAAGVNGLLNYGYAVLRSGVARAVMASGLHPSLGLMHANRSNAMVLIDDLMEPFRPTVDLEVRRLIDDGVTEVDAEAKPALARVMILDLPTAAGMSPVMICAERLAQSLVRAYGGDGDKLDLPLPRLPLEG